MGSCYSKICFEDRKIAPDANEQLTENGNDDLNVIINENRTSTDVFFIIFFILFLSVLIVLLFYCMSYGNIYRIVNGYDNCGNICGRLNTFEVTTSGCRGMDLTQHKYLRVQSLGTYTSDMGQINRICVENCGDYPGFKTFLNRCLPEKSQRQVNSFFSKTGISEFFQEVAEDLNTCWQEIIYMNIIAFCVSVMILILFKYFAGVLVWLVLIGVVIICVIGTILLWIRYAVELNADPDFEIGKRRVKVLLWFSVVATITTVIICIVIVALRKRIQLVIQLFKEAGKAATSMPLLLFEPILTFTFLIGVISLWLYFAIWIESAGFLTVENNTSAKYVKDYTMKVTRWYNLLAMFWCSQFLIGCQHMVIAGAVSAWFFTRNKSELNSPIISSFNRLIRYHLGTVAFGSFLIASIQFVRAALSFVEYTTRNPGNRLTQCLFTSCQCCLVCFENALKYITRNAYIETAIYGYPFCIAGRKAFNHLSANTLRVLAINSVGDFVLFLGKALVVFFTIIAGIELLHHKEDVHHMWVLLVLAGLFAYLIAHSFITVYEVTIDTIFLCFCEDCERNDGMQRPYFMSRGLMEFVQNSKKALKVHDQDQDNNENE